MNTQVQRSLVRRKDWQQRLNTYVTTVRDMPFAYGTNDCVTFCIGCIRAMTDTDIGANARSWSTYEESEEVIAEEGRGSLYRVLRKYLGVPVKGAQGQRGDIAFHQGSCGVILGPYAMFFGIKGYVFVHITRVQRAFKVGHD